MPSRFFGGDCFVPDHLNRTLARSSFEVHKGRVEFLHAMASRGLALWTELSQVQQIIVGAVGALLGYLVLSSIVRSLGRMAWIGLILVIAFAALRIALPDTLCTVRWPAPIASMCSK